MSETAGPFGLPRKLDQQDLLHVDRLDKIEIRPGPGDMGLKGLWALIGNGTAMVALAIVLFLALGQVRAMHEEGITTLKQLVLDQREVERSYIRDQIRSNTELKEEMAKLRMAIEGMRKQ